MKNYFVYLIFLLAFLERTVFDLGPNFELITLAMVLSSFYLTSNSSLLFTFFLILTSDLIIGNSNIFIFTWSGFLIPVLFLGLFKKLKINKIFSGTLAGISSNLFFFVWTNFGVWLLDSWGMYPKTAYGLASSYINGLPFLKYQLISTLLFIPLGLFIYQITFKSLPTFSKIKRALSRFSFE